jgi:hypothetical protein
MASIKVDISVMPVTDLLQWIDPTPKTGPIKLNISRLIFAFFKRIEKNKITTGTNP